jgi:hypothetical protein
MLSLIHWCHKPSGTRGSKPDAASLCECPLFTASQTRTYFSTPSIRTSGASASLHAADTDSTTAYFDAKGCQIDTSTKHAIRTIVSRRNRSMSCLIVGWRQPHD